MHPAIHFNFVAVAIAVVASFIFGWIWFGPLFGKKWASLMGMSMDKKPEAKMMIKSMVLGIIGTALTAYVLTYSTAVWRPSVWGIGTDDAFYMFGFESALFTWLGFYVPMLLNTVAWEGRSWSLFSLNAAYHFVNLQIIAMILSYWY